MKKGVTVRRNARPISSMLRTSTRLRKPPEVQDISSTRHITAMSLMRDEMSQEQETLMMSAGESIEVGQQQRSLQ